MRRPRGVGRVIRRPLTTIREVPGEVRIEYVDREVPVEVQVKDDQTVTNLERAIQEQRTRAEAAESQLAEAQASKPEPAVGPSYRFNVSALQEEFDPMEDNNLGETDARLSAEFDDLEARLEHVNPEGLDRHTFLGGKLYRKVGA